MISKRYSPDNHTYHVALSKLQNCQKSISFLSKLHDLWYFITEAQRNQQTLQVITPWPTCDKSWADENSQVLWSIVPCFAISGTTGFLCSLAQDLGAVNPIVQEHVDISYPSTDIIQSPENSNLWKKEFILAYSSRKSWNGAWKQEREAR